MSISYIIFVIILAIVGGMLYTAESELVNIDVYDKESKKISSPFCLITGSGVELDMKVKELIEKYNMQEHPEGGYYAETYTNEEQIDGKPLATSIYFLLEQDDISKYHRLQSDEVWYHHEGGTLLISMILKDGTHKEVLLGNSEGAVHQFTVPRNTIFGSRVYEGTYAFVGCMVSHGFSFDEFELFTTQELRRAYPEIKKLFLY